MNLELYNQLLKEAKILIRGKDNIDEYDIVHSYIVTNEFKKVIGIKDYKEGLKAVIKEFTKNSSLVKSMDASVSEDSDCTLGDLISEDSVNFIEKKGKTKNTQFKFCFACGQEKALSKFSPDLKKGKKVIRYYSECKECHSKRITTQFKEKLKDENFKKLFLEKTREYLKTEERKKWTREYKKRAYVKNKIKEYKEKNKEKILLMARTDWRKSMENIKSDPIKYEQYKQDRIKELKKEIETLSDYYVKTRIKATKQYKLSKNKEISRQDIENKRKILQEKRNKKLSKL